MYKRVIISGYFKVNISFIKAYNLGNYFNDYIEYLGKSYVQTRRKPFKHNTALRIRWFRITVNGFRTVFAPIDNSLG